VACADLTPSWGFRAASGAGTLAPMPTAIVTGGNSGIGKGICVTLAGRGFDIGLTWHEADDHLQEVQEEIRREGRRVESAQMDLDVPVDQLESRCNAVAGLSDALGGIDVFVHNAGAGLPDEILECSFEDWMSTQNIVLNAGFLLGRLAGRRMRDQGRGGRIVYITSVHEHVPLRGNGSYVAAKHGLGGLVKNFAMEVAALGITVNAVAPGEIATRMTGQEDQDPGESERPGIPTGRPGHAREIAWMVAALCEPDARYATGQSYVVDGGMLLMAAEANRLAL
jgi:NAD(P)-dependent dehydrogenase (short-subunit alcohol dehydrogenase family)